MSPGDVLPTATKTMGIPPNKYVKVAPMFSGRKTRDATARMLDTTNTITVRSLISSRLTSGSPNTPNESPVTFPLVFCFNPSCVTAYVRILRPVHWFHFVNRSISANAVDCSSAVAPPSKFRGWRSSEASAVLNGIVAGSTTLTGLDSASFPSSTSATLASSRSCFAMASIFSTSVSSSSDNCSDVVVRVVIWARLAGTVNP
mmetsp:Transcript_19787/g.22781  ORF Transcript_19787/g.22781 Transcript_19787/m.22781 type:complete len:202 (-) Transcript_19787:66-671(-)